MVEALAALLGSLLWARFGLSVSLLIWFPLTMCLLAIACIDMEHYWIPDVLVWPAACWVLLCVCLPGAPYVLQSVWGLLPALLLWAVAWCFQRLTKKEGLGLGDVKLLALLGLALGPWNTLCVLFWASLQGSVLGGIWVACKPWFKKWERKEDPQPAVSLFDDGWVPPPRAIPMGPFLVLGAVEVLFWPGVFTDFLDQIR